MPETQTKHECGGVILWGTVGMEQYHYCGSCGAFHFLGMSGPFPTGTDKAANERAWNMAEARSPYAPVER